MTDFGIPFCLTRKRKGVRSHKLGCRRRWGVFTSQGKFLECGWVNFSRKEDRIIVEEKNLWVTGDRSIGVKTVVL